MFQLVSQHRVSAPERLIVSQHRVSAPERLLPSQWGVFMQRCGHQEELHHRFMKASVEQQSFVSIGSHYVIMGWFMTALEGVLGAVLQSCRCPHDSENICVVSLF